VAPPDGALLLAGIVGLHGLTVGFLFVAARKLPPAANRDLEPARSAHEAARLRRNAIMRSL
jgi:hypothetical protein